MQTNWPALAAARWQLQPRTAFHIDGGAVGSVATAHVPALHRWAKWIAQDARGLHLVAPAAGRDDALARHVVAELVRRLAGSGTAHLARQESIA